MLPYASDKAKIFIEKLSAKSKLDDSGISLLALFRRTNLEMYNTSVTPKLKYHNRPYLIVFQ